jgi:hypothetical protein
MTRFKLFGVFTILSTLTTMQLPAYGSEGREVVAPPWSFACLSDQGPRDCGELMWVYGAREQLTSGVGAEHGRNKHSS